MGDPGDETRINALFSKVTSLVDGGWRLTFDITQQDVGAIADLSRMLQTVVTLTVSPGEEPEREW